MLQMSEMGIENMIKFNEGFRKGVYVYNGSVTNKHLAKTFNLPYKNIDLVMAALSEKATDVSYNQIRPGILVNASSGEEPVDHQAFLFGQWRCKVHRDRPGELFRIAPSQSEHFKPHQFVATFSCIVQSHILFNMFVLKAWKFPRITGVASASHTISSQEWEPAHSSWDSRI